MGDDDACRLIVFFLVCSNIQEQEYTCLFIFLIQESADNSLNKTTKKIHLYLNMLRFPIAPHKSNCFG